MKSMSLNALFLAAAIFTFGIGAAAQQSTDHSHDQDKQDQPKSAMMSMMQMMQSCPMSVQGTDVQTSDTPGGIAVAVTTKSGDVAELRRRVEAMAKMHSAPSNGAATPAQTPMMQGQMMAFTVKYEEITNGSRLTLTPKDPAQLNELRIQVRKHAEQMKKGDCAMMQNMMQGMMQGTMDGMKSSAPAPTAPAPKADDSDHDGHHPAGDGK